MSADERAPRPQLMAGGRSDEREDPRIAAVLAVLAGHSTTEVATQHAVDQSVLQRWVRAFVDAGTAQVTNRPIPDQRDRFLAAFAHEVRTPTLVASGWAAMLREGAIPPERIDATLDRMCEALDGLAERVLDVELLAASSLGWLTLSREPVTVDDLTTGLPGLVEIDGEGGEVQIEVDPTYFPRVLRDLWQTAQLPPVPQTVRMEVRTVSPWVELRVVREAEPMSPEVLRGLFEPFDSEQEVTGMTTGLYLARALAVAHGGTIGAEQDDHRATLWVRVPRRPPRTDRA